MRVKHVVAFGLVLALPAFLSSARLSANDGILSRLHHHQADCQAKQTVVRLPAQDIRVETTAPRVVVNERVGHHGRMRGFFPTAGPMFMPVTTGPFVATFVPMNVNAGLFSGATTAGSTALDAVHAMERQHLEFAKQKAALRAEMDHVESAYKRVHSGLTAPGADASSVQKSLDELTKRVSDIERLLIIHDNVLQKITPPPEKIGPPAKN